MEGFPCLCLAYAIGRQPKHSCDQDTRACLEATGQGLDSQVAETDCAAVSIRIRLSDHVGWYGGIAIIMRNISDLLLP